MDEEFVEVPREWILERHYWVYRFWNESGECLYVGVTVGKMYPDGIPLFQRLAQHLTRINPSHAKSWASDVARVEACKYDSPYDAERAETKWIDKLCPIYNRAKQTHSRYDVLLFDWDQDD